MSSEGRAKVEAVQEGILEGKQATLSWAAKAS